MTPSFNRTILYLGKVLGGLLLLLLAFNVLIIKPIATYLYELHRIVLLVG